MNGIFKEQDFFKQMNTTVSSFIRENCREEYIKGHENNTLHVVYALHPLPKGSIAICHGFCEFFGKYHEVFYYFYQQGFSVFYVDHKGHGSSQRSVEDLEKVHIDSFDEYVEDYKCFMDQIVLPNSGSGRKYLYAHSMGGAVAALFFEKYPMYFDKAVLSSPMMQVNFGKYPEKLIQADLIFHMLKKEGKKYAAGQHGFNPDRKWEDSGCMLKERYEYTQKLRKEDVMCQTSGGTNAWFLASIRADKKLLRHAKKVKIPVLLFQAGQDKLVKPKGQDIFAKKARNVTKIVFPQSKHEIFNGTMQIQEKYYQMIFEFFS